MWWPMSNGSLLVSYKMSLNGAGLTQKMSLKRRSDKLGIDHERGKQEGIEPRQMTSAGQR